MDLPIASVAVDTGIAHLDRPFDYAVPAVMADRAAPGCRVRVRFAGRLVDGVILGRSDASEHEGSLTALHALVSAEPVLTSDVARLARAVADRSAGSLFDVLRLALPPRHARVEGELRTPDDAAPTADPPRCDWTSYPAGPAFLEAVAAGRGPRAVWSALPGSDWSE
ncbi:MAG: hypothetical protein M3N21_09220, partial [Actinomycetota bacterium]|nr:hypothetical protein [Actinomycetota bacterium]